MVLAVEKHEEDMSSRIPETKVGTHLSGVHMADALHLIRYQHTMKCVLRLGISSFLRGWRCFISSC